MVIDCIILIGKSAVKPHFTQRSMACLANVVDIPSTIDKNKSAAKEDSPKSLPDCRSAVVLSQSTSSNKGVTSLMVTSRVVPGPTLSTAAIRCWSMIPGNHDVVVTSFMVMVTYAVKEK